MRLLIPSDCFVGHGGPFPPFGFGARPLGLPPNFPMDPQAHAILRSQHDFKLPLGKVMDFVFVLQ